MLESDLIESAILRRTWTAQQRRIALAESHDMAVIVDKREQLAIAPHAALIERSIRHSPFAPCLLQRRGVEGSKVVTRLQQTAAFRAVIKHVGDAIMRVARAVDTDE